MLPRIYGDVSDLAHWQWSNWYQQVCGLMSTGGWHFDIQNPLITKWAPPATRASKLATFDEVFESLSKMRKRDQKWGPRGKSLSVV